MIRFNIVIEFNSKYITSFFYFKYPQKICIVMAFVKNTRLKATLLRVEGTNKDKKDVMNANCS